MILAAGILLWLIVTVDVIATTISIAGHGPASRLLAQGVWRMVCRGLLRPARPLAAVLSGPLVLTTVVGFWVAGTWGAWTLIFLSDDSAVVDSATKAPAGLAQTLAYAGSKLSTLGSGLAEAGSPAWDAVSILPAINGMILLSLTASYALSLVGVTTRARTLAVRVDGLPRDRLSSQPGEALAGLHDAFLRSAIDLNAYPLASYFSPRDPAAHIPSAVLRLTDTLTQEGVVCARPPLGDLWRGLEALTARRIGALASRSDLRAAVEAWYRRYSLHPLPDWWRPAAKEQAGRASRQAA